MEGSMASTNPVGLLVRKSLFGSRLDSILVSSFQLGEKRSAHCPATITHRNPITRIMGIMIQSDRSRSDVFIAMPVDRQSHKDRCARVRCFVVARTFKPDASVMSVHNAA